MGNNKIFKIPFQRKNEGINVSLCLSKQSFESLHDSAATYLHTNEINYLHNILHQKRQRSFLLGRFCAKRAIADLIPNVLSTEIEIEKGIFGFPLCRIPMNNHLAVSISHSGHYGAAIAHPDIHPMGIDIETIQPDRIDSIAEQMSNSEIEQAQKVCPERNLALTLLWSSKEALSKVIKCGMMMDYSLLEPNNFEKVADRTSISYNCTFKHFGQYQAQIFEFDKKVLSVVFPKNTKVIYWPEINL